MSYRLRSCSVSPSASTGTSAACCSIAILFFKQWAETQHSAVQQQQQQAQGRRHLGDRTPQHSQQSYSMLSAAPQLQPWQGQQECAVPGACALLPPTLTPRLVLLPRPSTRVVSLHALPTCRSPCVECAAPAPSCPPAGRPSRHAPSQPGPRGRTALRPAP